MIPLLYGRIDLQNNPVQLLEENLKQIGDIFVIDFVAKAYEDLSKYLIQSSIQGIISSNGSFSSLSPTKGWESVENLYNKHINGLYKIFLTTTNFNKILTFKDFVKSFLTFLPQNFPFLKSQFLISNFCSIYTSGLLFDFGPQKDYTRDSSYDYFLLAAQKFGFLVEENRLIANLQSSAMKKYMMGFGIGSMAELFENYYKKPDDGAFVKYYFYQMYQSFYSSYPFARMVFFCNGKTRSKIVKRIPPDEKDLTILGAMLFLKNDTN